MTVLRRFTPDGMVAFAEYLQVLKASGTGDAPTDSLTNLKHSESVAPRCVLPTGDFENRWELASALHDAFEEVGLKNVERDERLWAWLACHYFDLLCPANGHGKRAPGARPLYILESGNWQRYYRHLLAGPFRVFRANRDNPKRCLALLMGRPDTPGDLYEQIAATTLASEFIRQTF